MKKLTVGSLFSGCGGFDIGFHDAGFDVCWQVEIDATARDVLARHWPDVERHEDVRKVGKKNLGRVDVIVGGFPCQDLSTAGRRGGFAGGERSSLFFEMVRVIRELRPRYVVWENVPGLLSSEEGRDFLAVLLELGELGFGGGWRTFDAQFFGVPQQRRRVFGVFARGRAGAFRCAEILALREGGTRRTPSRRKKGQGVATTLTRGSGSAGVNPPGRRKEDDINLVVSSLQGGGQRGYRLDAEAAAGGQLVYGGGNTEGERGVCAALTAKSGTRQDFDTENFVLAVRTAQTGANGIGVSERAHTPDGSGAQAVVIPLDMRQASRGETMTNNRAEGSSGGAPGTGIGKPGDPSPTIGLTHTPAVAVCVTGVRTHALTSEGGDASEDGTGRGTPIVFNWQSGGDCRLNPSEVADAQSVGQTPAVLAFAQNQREVRFVDPPPAVTCGGGKPGEGYPAAMVGSLVRRLTPRECDRLMGWPDDFTRYRANGKEIADGPRYRMCGNGVVGTVAKWLAKRLSTVMRKE